MWASVIDFSSKMSIFWNIDRFKSTLFGSSYYSLQRVQIIKGSSRKLTTSYTTRDAFMNLSFAFSRDVGLGCRCLN